MIPKFKIGDRVKVLRASTEDETELWGDTWTWSMNNSIKKVFIITNCVNNDRVYNFNKYKLNDASYCWFPEFILEPEVVKGQQLLFSFMKE